MKTRQQIREERKEKGFCQCRACLEQDVAMEKLRERLFGPEEPVRYTYRGARFQPEEEVRE